MVQEHRGAIRDTPRPAARRCTSGLADRAAALRGRPLPAAPGDAETGRQRLAYDELLALQMTLLARRARRHEAGRAAPLDAPRELTERWLTGGLPFPPTGDQLRAADAVDADLAKDRPMQRLLMGEVGSGKTVIALFALLRAVEHGRQGAFMAPTETLAEQHFRTVQELLPGELVRVALLTGSTPAAPAQRDPPSWLERRARADRRHPRADRAVGRVLRSRGGRRRRAAPLRGAPARRARRQGARRAAPARPAHDRHADPAHARADRLRRPRRDRAARAPARPAADHHLPGHERHRARAGLRAHPRGAARRPPGLRRVPARDRVGLRRRGARGRGRVGGAAHRRAQGLLRRPARTASCRPRRSRP